MMKWNALLCSKRPSKNEYDSIGDLRSEFEKDYHRIIESSCFRRLQDKTQVFPLDKSDFIRTRLTHSLEVSSLGRSLGQNITNMIISQKLDDEMDDYRAGEICEVLQCAGLVHDIGNPPFGHFGEETIRDWFQKNLEKIEFNGKKITDVLSEQQINDLYNFEGNAQGLRMLSKLHFLGNKCGMNLTYALLSAIIKYPVSSVQMDKMSNDVKMRKMGFFSAEEALAQMIMSSCETGTSRNPLTFILEAADDIAYATADIEDAFKKGFINIRILLKELKVRGVSQSAIDLLNEFYSRALESDSVEPEESAIMEWLSVMQDRLIVSATEGFVNNYSEVMNGKLMKPIVSDGEGALVLDALKGIAYDYAFVSKEIFRTEIAANTIITFILDKIIPAVLAFDNDEAPGLMEEKYITLIPESYKQVYRKACIELDNDDKIYYKILMATDFISSMTDSYARDLYEELNGYKLH